MGSANLSCEAPCTCAPLEPLDGHEPGRGNTVTVLRAIRVTRTAMRTAAQAAAEEAPPSCVLRLGVLRGPRSGGETYVVNSLIATRPRSVSGATLMNLESTLSGLVHRRVRDAASGRWQNKELDDI